MTCNYCNRQGHLERECRTKQREVGQQPQARIAQLQQNPPSSGEEMYLFNSNITNTTGFLQQNPPSSGEEMYLFNTSLTKTTG